MDIKTYYKKYIKYIELLLAVIAGIALVAFSVSSIRSFVSADWSLIDTFYSFISTILLILLGLELIRLMLFHSLNTVLELIILVIARKLLAPNVDALSILLSVVSITIIVGLIYLLHYRKIESLEDLSQ